VDAYQEVYWPQVFRIKEYPVPHAFSTRACGDMKGAAAQQVYFRKTVGAPVQFVHLFPEHGKRVRFVRRPLRVVKGDAVVTDVNNLALAMLPADCPPIIIADRSLGLLAMVHGGRNSLMKGVLEATYRTLDRKGMHPSCAEVLIGPAIRPCCYEFPTDHPIIQSLEKAGWSEDIYPCQKQGRSFSKVDLVGRIIRVLNGFGISNILTVPQCTCCGQENGEYIFPSSRRSELEEGPEDRYMAIAWLP
jgi:polyphenol oxidase